VPDNGVVFGGGPTWQAYPADVPADQRVACAASGCERPGEIVEMRSSLLGSAITGTSATTTAWCLEHATAHGYTEPSTSPAPHDLNAFQRLVVHFLDRR
jgi:hypothetical protein